MDSITNSLKSEFKMMSAKFKTTSITHLKDLQTELMSWRLNNSIAKKFYSQNYGQFVFHPPPTIPNTQSIIIIGLQQTITTLEFFYHGKPHRILIPPTYLYTDIRARCAEILSRILGTKGHRSELAVLPMKLLAVRTGLGKYGRNNLCYVEGMGSLTRLQAFYTDYKFPTDDWGEKQLMDSCTRCSLCRDACPTHSIPEDRILIHADRCLTYLNENEGDFPTWLPTQAHNALVGCLHCQTICPQNKQYLRYSEPSITFTEDETTILLQQTPREDIPQALRKKLLDIDIVEYYSVLARNLSALLKGSQSTR